LYESFWYLNKQTNKSDMKTKLLAVMATLGMVASASAVKINNNLSINGFIDGSYNTSDNGAADTSNIGLDEVELNLILNAGNVSGELHLDTEDTDNDQAVSLEQVHFTYSFGNGASATVGRFNSALGLEGEDPAGLYTFSRAYSPIGGAVNPFNLGDIDNNGAQEGVRLSYSAGDLSGSLALYDSIDSTLEAGGTKDDLDYELALNYTGLNNITLGAGFQTDRSDSTVATTDVEIYTINVTYTLDKLFLAAEYANRQDDGETWDEAAYMVLADYDVNDKLGVAVRYSSWETGANTEAEKLTFAPNYAITDSLGAIIEFSAEEEGLTETDTFAVELTYTF
jgi:predicted porin